MTKQNATLAWESISVVQTAGNALEKRVTEMGEAAVLVRLDQQDKNDALKELWRTMDGDIT
jgi:hypothetical protein